MRTRPPLAEDARSLRDPRHRGDAPADAGRAGRAAVPRLARALADRRGARRCTPSRDVIREWQGLGYNRRAVNLHRAARHIADQRLAGRPHRAPRRRPLHGGRRGGVCVRRSGPPRGHQRAPRAGADRPSFRARVRAGADGPRRDDLPGPHPALRHLPAGFGMPLARAPLRAAAAPGPRSRAPSGSGGLACSAPSPSGRVRLRSWTLTRSRRSSGTASCGSRTAA